MRQAFIFKTLFLVLFMSSSSFLFAQNSTKISSETHNSTTIEIDISKNQKLSLTDKDDRFNMSLRFKKEHTTDVREMLSQELGRTSSKTAKKQVWTSKNGAYTFELKEGNLYVNIIKNQLKEAEYETLRNLGSASLELVGFNVNLE